MTAIEPRALPTIESEARSNHYDSDRVSPTQLWIIAGQVALAFSVFFGFGAQRLTPKLTSAGAMALTFGFYFLAPHGRYRRLVLSVPVLVFIWWWMMSGFWTRNPFGWSIETQRNLGLVLSVMVIVSLLPTEHIVRGLLVTFYATIVFQYFWTATHFSTATANIDEMTGFPVPGWRGSFVHKNTMGPFLIFAIATIMLFERRAWLRRGSIALALFLIVMSDSATTWSVLSVVLLLIWWLRRLVRNKGRMKPAFVALSVCGGFVMMVLGSLVIPFLLSLAGKNLTFTGRTRIWANCLVVLRQEPWFGFGLGGVWSNPAAEPTKTILANLGFVVFHAHNAYLEVALQFGIIGVLIWVSIPLFTIVDSLRLQRVHPQIGQWALVFACSMLMIGMSEVVVFGGWLPTIAAMRIITARELKRPHIWHDDLPHDKDWQ